MASHRKDSITGSIGLAQRLNNKAAAPAVSTEYLEALKVLNEETMAKACELLLSDRDYQDPPPETTDLKQLQDMYQQCSKACAVIEKEAATLPTTTLPAVPLRGPMAQQRSSSVTGVPTKHKMPNRRMARLPPPAKAKSSTLKRPPVERQMSDPSMQAAAGAKRPRTGSISLHHKKEAAFPSTAAESNPPPAAMQFLAKLNKDKAPAAAAASPSNKATTTKKATSPPSSSSNTKPTAAPSPSRPVRTQPSRASRNH